MQYKLGVIRKISVNFYAVWQIELEIHPVRKSSEIIIYTRTSLAKSRKSAKL